jgi:hypothetical protein
MKRTKNVKYYFKAKDTVQVNETIDSSINIEEIIKTIAERQDRNDTFNTDLFISYTEWLKLNVALYNCPEDIERIRELVVKYKMYRRSDKNRLTNEAEPGNFTTHNFSRLSDKRNNYATLIAWLKRNKFMMQPHEADTVSPCETIKPTPIEFTLVDHIPIEFNPNDQPTPTSSLPCSQPTLTSSSS